MTVMDEVWQDTVVTIDHRRGLFALLALGFFVPPVLHAIWLAATTVPGAPPAPLPTSAFGLVTTVVALWAQLAIIAAAALAVSGTVAVRAGVRRLLPALGVELLILLVLGLILVPMIAILARHGVNLQAMSTSAATNLSAANILVVMLSGLLFLVASLFVGARLLLVLPVIAAERRGIGAIARSWALTRGMTWRIIGVLILFVIVIGVAVLAAQSVTGVAAALLTGPDSGIPALVAAIAGAAVTAALSVVAIVFTARLWHTMDADRPA